jgi:hypothetical protein
LNPSTDILVLHGSMCGVHAPRAGAGPAWHIEQAGPAEVLAGEIRLGLARTGMVPRPDHQIRVGRQRAILGGDVIGEEGNAPRTLAVAA